MIDCVGKSLLDRSKRVIEKPISLGNIREFLNPLTDDEIINVRQRTSQLIV